MGVCGNPGVPASVNLLSVSGVGSSPVGNAVPSTSRPVRSGKQNSFKDHVVHRHSIVELVPSSLRYLFKFLTRRFRSIFVFFVVF